MLIYELQGFSLTILSLTETERGGGKDREREREGKTDERFRTDKTEGGGERGEYCHKYTTIYLFF